MPDRSGGRRRLLIAVAVAAVVGGFAAAALIGGDDEERGAGRRQPQTAPAAQKPETGTGPARSTKEQSRRRQQKAQAIQETVTALVQSSERGDGEAFCEVVGRRPGGATGLAALRRCAAAAGIDPTGLPTSDELSIAKVRAFGNTGRARLVDGRTIFLRLEGGDWKVRRVTR